MMDTNNSGHKIIDLKNRIEASVAIWRPAISLEKREVFEERGETVLIILRQRFPGIHQSALDISKVQYNEDAGRSCPELVILCMQSSLLIIHRIFQERTSTGYPFNGPGDTPNLGDPTELHGMEWN
ncbi:hypothetical protein SAY87_005652 [Trapa incisa]|uniref:PRONE domain-containing protein n=1 Tax=Trapa incisa TaxID=236973 RepID=A0AAN7Q7X5_9MYRT|nr:hypothetical protein SAY87_005652 [Trapa incisa]